MKDYILLALSILTLIINFWLMHRAEKRREWLSGALHLAAVIIILCAIVDRINAIIDPLLKP